MTTEQRPTPVLFGDGIEQERRQKHVRINAMYVGNYGYDLGWYVSGLSLGRIGSRNAKFNCIPFALRAERYRTRWTAFHSTRCAERALRHFAHLRCQHFPTQLPSTALQRTPFHHPINFLNGTAWKGEGCIHLSSFIGHLSDVPIPTTHESLARYS